MVRRVSVSQLRSQLRQAANKQRQLIDAHNREVRRVNHNRQQAVNRYNQEVRAYNARVRAHRQRVTQALSRLQSQTVTVRFQAFRTSVHRLHATFVTLDERYRESSTPEHDELLELSERETANSLDVANALLAEPGAPADTAALAVLQSTELSDELRALSPDLDDRWKGALFALSPRNPDAARHFCTSAREIMDGILNAVAPGEKVVADSPGCERTPQGSPTRRARVGFLMRRKGTPEFEDFVTEDVENIVELFPLFNSATHGRAGRFVLEELGAIKRRVEHAVQFLARIAR